MTAPHAPARDKAPAKQEPSKVAETPERNRVDELASLNGLLPVAGSDLTFLDPSQVITLQRNAGNQAVNGLIQRAPRRRQGSPANGVQRSPMNLMQRAPAENAPGDIEGRVDRIRHAIEFETIPPKFKIDVDGMATALAEMTPTEGKAVAQLFESRYHWNLRFLIAGVEEIGSLTVGNDLGPKNRRRFLNLISGTVAQTQDPTQAMTQAQEFAKTYLPDKLPIIGDVSSTVGAVAFVTTRATNAVAEKEATANRLKVQAIEIKSWLDNGKKDKIFAYLRTIATPAMKNDRNALDDAYRQEFNQPLYTALSNRLTGRDQERVLALWTEQIARADALAVEGQLEKVAKAEEMAKKIEAYPIDLGDTKEKTKKAAADERAALEDQLLALKEQPAATGDESTTTSALDAAVTETSGGTTLGIKLAARKDVVVQNLLANKAPERIGSALGRSDREGLLKGSEIESALREVRDTAESDYKKQLKNKADDSPSPPDASALASDYFRRFRDAFNAESSRPLEFAIAAKGNTQDKTRNLTLLQNKGVLLDWQEMYFAVGMGKKDLDRVRRILGKRSKSQIAELAAEYKANTTEHRDMSDDILGTSDYQRMIRNPKLEDFRSGKFPSDLNKARTEYDEMRNLLEGGVFEPGAASVYERQLADEVSMATAANHDPSGLSGPPVPDAVVASIKQRYAKTRSARELLQEAEFVFRRISTREVSAEYHKGSFAYVRDEWVGNTEYDIVKRTGTDAAVWLQGVEEALYKNPPDEDTANKLVNKLYLTDARMKYNIGVYNERTEAAFNAFVDAVVLVVTTLATAGEGGAIMMAIRATAATVATKATLKGGAYGADEFWGDVRGGVFNAVGGKLSEKFVGGMANWVAVKYAARAERLGLKTGWGTWLASNAGKAATWEADNLVSGAAASGLEVVSTGNEEAFSVPMSLSSTAEAIGQHNVHKAIRARRESRAKARREGSTAAKPSTESTPTRTTSTEPSATTAAVVVGRPAPEPAATAAPPAPMRLPGPGESGQAEPVARRDTRPESEGTGSERRRKKHRGDADEVPTVRRDARRQPNDDIDIPHTNKPADQLDITPGSALDKQRGRDNREETRRRESEFKRDLDAIRSAGRPDARARQKAAEFEPLFDEWERLKPTERKERIREIINAQLAQEGGHPVKVEFGGDLAPGNAQFSPRNWEMRLSSESLTGDRMSIGEFSELVAASVHEARHSLHYFRGMRVALARGNIDLATLKTKGINADAIAQADAANGRRDPQDELSKEAHDEVLEIFDVGYQAERRRKKYGAEAVDRSKVYSDKETAAKANDAASSAFKAADAEVDRLENEGKAGTREHADALNKKAAARDAWVHAAEGLRVAENKYPALPEETEAWRIDAATEAAMAERLMLRSELKDVQRARQMAAEERRKARDRQDAVGEKDADERVKRASSELARLNKDLDALAKGGEPKAIQVAPPDTGSQAAASPEAPAQPPRKTNANVIRRPPKETSQGESQTSKKPTNVNVIRRPEADFGGDTQVDLVPLGKEAGQSHRVEGESNPLPTARSKAQTTDIIGDPGRQPATTPTAPQALRPGAEDGTRAQAGRGAARDPARPVETKPADTGRAVQPDAARARRDADDALRQAEANLKSTENELRTSPIRRAAEEQYAAAWRAQAKAYGRSLGGAAEAGRRAKADERLAKAEMDMQLVRGDPPTSPMRRLADAELLAARKEHQQAYGTWKEPPPFRWDHEIVIQLHDSRNFAQHRELFFSMMRDDPTREIGVFRNSVTGEVIVVRGNERAVTVQAGGTDQAQGPMGRGSAQRWKEILSAGSDVGNWELLEHSHPSPRRGVPAGPIQQVPSGATGDFGLMVRDSMEDGWRPKNSRIFYETAKGRQSTEFGFDPRSPQPYWFAVAGGPVVRFDSLEAYHNYVRITLNADPGHVPPGMPSGGGLGRYQAPGGEVAGTMRRGRSRRSEDEAATPTAPRDRTRRDSPDTVDAPRRGRRPALSPAGAAPPPPPPTQSFEERVLLGALDEHGRATYVAGELHPADLRTGSRAAVDPPGLGRGELNYPQDRARQLASGGPVHPRYRAHRGHLLGNLFGGTGTDPRNLVWVHERINLSDFKTGFENAVRNALEGGKGVRFSIEPQYRSGEAAPYEIVVWAQTTDGEVIVPATRLATPGLSDVPLPGARMPDLPDRETRQQKIARWQAEREVARARRAAPRGPTVMIRRGGQLVPSAPRALEPSATADEPTHGTGEADEGGAPTARRDTGGPTDEPAPTTERGRRPPRVAEASKVPADEFAGETPPTTARAEDLDIKPGSRLDTERGRSNRAEQLRRQSEHIVNERSLQGGAQPGGQVEEGTRADARARARAADYAPVFSDWATLGDAGRRDRIEKIINAQLAREGIPPVKVVFGEKPPGSAEFAADMWTMSISRASIEAKSMSIAEFATLADNAVHETQHAVTTFRGIRVALAARRFNPRVYVDEGVVMAARAANERSHPAAELDAHALGEAYEIYKVSIEPDRASGAKVPPGGVNREEVLARKEVAKTALDNARTEYEVALDMVHGKPGDSDRLRSLAEARAKYQNAYREFVAAHNAYIALPEETFSWRAGSAVKAAVIERLTLEADLANANQRASDAALEHRTLRNAQNEAGAADALRRSLAERQAAAQIKARIDALAPTEGTSTDTGRAKRETPLAETEVQNAPRAQRVEDDDLAVHPPKRRARATLKPRPAESTSVDTPAKVPPRRQAAQTDTHEGAGPPAGPPLKGATTNAPGPQVQAPDAPAPHAPVAHAPSGVKRELDSTPTGDATYEFVKERETPAGTNQKAVGATFGPSEIGIGARAKQTPPGGGHSQQYAKANLTAQGLGGEVGNLKTTPGGTTHGVVGGVRFDSSGNPTLEAGYLIQGKSGSSIKPTFSKGRRVDAAEPEPLPDGTFIVRYSVTDTTSAGIGGEGKLSQSGPGVGGSISKFSADASSGSKIFGSKDEADAFRENAAALLQFDGGLEVPTSWADVKQLKVGESRGSASTEGTATSISASYMGASLGRNTTESTTHGLSIEKVGDNIVNVTANVTTEKAKEWAASGLFLNNAKGKSSSHGFSVILQFDLTKPAAQAGFDFYMKTGIPAMGGWKNVGEVTIDTQATYDKYDIPLLGTAAWSEPQWESTTIDEEGRGLEIGGGAEHQQDPTWLARKTGDRKLFSSAQLIYRERGDKSTYTAVIRIKSESGEYNTEEFAKAFMGAHVGKSVTPSGEWIVSAQISKAVVEGIARNRDPSARSSADKARLMTAFMTDHAAEKAGGLMHSGAKKSDWMVELKGDPNFPGAAGNEKLETERASLTQAVKADPTSAKQVADRAAEVMAALDKRREAVADKGRYTDLPEELRDQQLALIDQHRNKFSALRQTAIQATMKSTAGEKIEDIMVRTTRKDWHKDLKGDERVLAKLQDVVALKDGQQRAQLDKDVRRFSIALGDVWQPDGSFAARVGVSTASVSRRLPETKEHYSSAMDMDKRASDLGPQLVSLRNAWLAVSQSDDVKAKLEALRAFDSKLDEYINLRLACIGFIKQAATTIAPIVTERSRSYHSSFWNSLGPPEEDDERVTYRPTAMALSK